MDCNQPSEEDKQPIPREEVEVAVASVKQEMSARVDNTRAGRVQAGGETTTDDLTAIYYNIRRTGECPTPWTQSLSITRPYKGIL